MDPGGSMSHGRPRRRWVDNIRRDVSAMIQDENLADRSFQAKAVHKY